MPQTHRGWALQHRRWRLAHAALTMVKGYMTTFDVLAAQLNFSRLVEAVDSGAETEIIIVRDGKPVAKLTPVHAPALGQRIGVAKGRFIAPIPDAMLDTEIEHLFTA